MIVFLSIPNTGILAYITIFGQHPPDTGNEWRTGGVDRDLRDAQPAGSADLLGKIGSSLRGYSKNWIPRAWPELDLSRSENCHYHAGMIRTEVPFGFADDVWHGKRY